MNGIKGRKMKKRIISVVLIVGMILSLAACKKNKEEIPEKNHSLTVESEDIEYSDEAINELAARIADISERFVPITGDSSLAEETKTARMEQKLKLYIYLLSQLQHWLLMRTFQGM